MKKLSQINETSWGGMVRRSNPEKEVRKEDDVNDMSPNDFFEYLKGNYKPIDRIWGISTGVVEKDVKYSIHTPLCKSGKSAAFALNIDYDENYNIQCVYTNKDLLKKDNMENILKDYDIFANGHFLINIHPKNGELSNRTYINILDKILQGVENPYTIKI